MLMHWWWLSIRGMFCFWATERIGELYDLLLEMECHRFTSLYIHQQLKKQIPLSRSWILIVFDLRKGVWFINANRCRTMTIHSAWMVVPWLRRKLFCRFPWNKGICLPQLPFGVRSCEVAIIWPDYLTLCGTWLEQRLNIYMLRFIQR